MTYDFAKDVEPVKFVLEDRVGFLHKFKGSANRLRKVGANEREILAIFRTLASQVNNYRLVLASCRGRMPDEKSEELLTNLLVYMDRMWNERKAITSYSVNVADKTCLSYCNLVDYLQSIK